MKPSKLSNISYFLVKELDSLSMILVNRLFFRRNRPLLRVTSFSGKSVALHSLNFFRSFSILKMAFTSPCVWKRIHQIPWGSKSIMLKKPRCSRVSDYSRRGRRSCWNPEGEAPLDTSASAWQSLGRISGATSIQWNILLTVFINLRFYLLSIITTNASCALESFTT